MKNYTFLVQKTQKIVSSKKFFCTNLLSPPCGGVDWNMFCFHPLFCRLIVTTLRWCGLKCFIWAYRYLLFLSPPCGGVDWNLVYLAKKAIDKLSPPCGGVDWNRIIDVSCIDYKRHHLAVVWIEILLCLNTINSRTVTTLRWCGLKFLTVHGLCCWLASPPCGGVDWNFLDCGFERTSKASPPCGGVDWNPARTL